MSKSTQNVTLAGDNLPSAKTAREPQGVTQTGSRPKAVTRQKPVMSDQKPHIKLSGASVDPRPSSKTRPDTPAPKKVKSGVIFANSVAALILDDLSRNHSDVCNYTPEAEMVRQGHIYLALEAIREKNRASVDIGPKSVWVKAQAEASLKKLVDPEFDRWPEAQKAWFATEHACHRTNQKLRAWVRRVKSDASPKKDVPFFSEVTLARAYIEWVVGSEAPIERIVCAGRHGPGSTVDVRGKAVHYLQKSGSLSCTPHAVDLACRSLSYDKGMWERLGLDPTYSHLDAAREGFVRVAKAELQPEIVNHDRLLFVHKGITSLRSIGAQATLNMLVQLGADSVMKDMLRDAGIDLTDQSLNQRLALIGSREWESPDTWCTLDKSSASNFNARELVNLLFPASWCRLLNRLRSPRYEAPKEFGGGMHEYHMYAGMGNGTTFAVESLIFASIAFATSGLTNPAQVLERRIFSVYGDDVIVRTAHAPRYIAMATYLGFRMNREKSFISGPFRESCGADYYKGVNVRPAYVVSEDGYCHELDIIGTHNTLIDHPNWKLLEACKGIRALFRRHINEKLPTDHSGGLGFRPVPGQHGYTTVKSKKGNHSHVSPVWHRVLYYQYSVRAKLDHVLEVTPWLALTTVLQKGTSIEEPGTGNHLALPYRKLVNIDLRPERDLVRKDLLQMITNQLCRIASHKKEPWFKETQGFVDENL